MRGQLLALQGGPAALLPDAAALPPAPRLPALAQIDVAGVINAADSATQGIHYGGECAPAAPLPPSNRCM